MSKNIKVGAIILHKGIPMYVIAVTTTSSAANAPAGIHSGRIMAIKSGQKRIFMTPLTQLGSLGVSALKTNT
jgi:hypothetical protein